MTLKEVGNKGKILYAPPRKRKMNDKEANKSNKSEEYPHLNSDEYFWPPFEVRIIHQDELH